jgi:hypothetical protein
MKMETQSLEELKSCIEKMTKPQQLEVLKILHANQDVKLNENKSGVYVNLSFLPENVLLRMRSYLSYIKDQESTLTKMESQKADFKHTYFENEYQSGAGAM